MNDPLKAFGALVVLSAAVWAVLGLLYRGLLAVFGNC